MTDEELNQLAIDGLNELEQLFSLPEREPHELDIQQIRKAMHCSKATAYGRMQQLVESGQWEFRFVRDPTDGLRRKVYYKVQSAQKCPHEEGITGGG